MSAPHVHAWLKLDVIARQKKVREFYATNSVELLDDLLGLVRAPRGFGIYASIGPNYEYAIFGRDSIVVAHDLIDIRPSLTKEIILLLASLQGCEFDMQSEEEEGKIHHEFRSVRFNNHKVSRAARLVLQRLGPIWGGTQDDLLYYGSYDATPLYIRLVSMFCQRYGDDALLNMQVTVGDGSKRTVRQSVRLATAWLVSKITASAWQLFEFKHLNPAGLVYQAWQDSNIAYLHADGTTANADAGIAAIELQGYAYDALYAAAELVAIDEHEANAWRHLASIVRDNTLQRLWMDNNYFAMGLDRSDEGNTRPIATITANPGLLLASDLFSRMPRHMSWPYIEGLVRMLFSKELLTTGGLRLRGRSHAAMVPFADYHGSLVTWPHQTAAIARGLRGHGFYFLATLLEDCILQSVGRAGEFYEFFFVDRAGRVKYHYRNEHPDEPTFHEFGAANLPEPGQAWTLSAILRIVTQHHNPIPALPVSDEVRKLEKEILGHEHVKAVIEASAVKLPY